MPRTPDSSAAHAWSGKRPAVALHQYGEN